MAYLIYKIKINVPLIYPLTGGD